MGMQNTQASYPRVCTHEPQSFSTELLESKGTGSIHLLQINNYPALTAPEVSFWDCVGDAKSFSDNAFSNICGKELHYLLNLRLLHEKLRYTCNSFCQILRKALLLEEIARIFLQNMQLFFAFKPIYVALRSRNTLVLQYSTFSLPASCLLTCHRMRREIVPGKRPGFL